MNLLLLSRAFARLSQAAAAGLVLAGIVLLVPRGAQGQSTCNGRIEISYASVPSPNTVGSVDRVRLQFGASGISGGTMLTMTDLFFDLDCKASMVGCVDDGMVVSYQGDSTISTTCTGISFSSTKPSGGADTNDIVFTASPTLDLPANTFPVCELQFDVKVLSLSNDSTPTVIEQRAGFATAECDNTGTASQIGTGSVPAAERTCVGVTGVLRSLPRR